MKQASASERRRWIQWHEAHGRNVAATSRHFGIARSTLYRWLKRVDPENPSKPLRAKSRRPHTLRQPTWPPEVVYLVANLNQRRPEWGSRRVQAALAAHGHRYAEATVGRILALVRAHCPICRKRGGQHNAMVHAWAVDYKTMVSEDVLYRVFPIPRRPRRRAKPTAQVQALIEQALGELSPDEAVRVAEAIFRDAKKRSGRD